MRSNWINWFRLSLNWPVACSKWGEKQQSASGSLQLHKLRSERLSRIFPSWVDSVCCIILFNQIYPFQVETPDSGSLPAKARICASLTEHIALSEPNPTLGGWHCPFGNHRELRAHLHRRLSGLLIPVMFSNSGGKHFRWAGALGSWTSAPYFLMRRFKASHKITSSICFTWWGERKKEKPSKTEYLKMQYLCSWRSELGPLPWMSFSSFV